jgi:hypothetical protein
MKKQIKTKVSVESTTDTPKAGEQFDSEEFIDIDVKELNHLLNREVQTDKDLDVLLSKQEKTNQLSDPFKDSYSTTLSGSTLKLIEPPYSLPALQKTVGKNNVVKQCVDIAVRSIEGTGGKIVYIGEEGKQEDPESLAEYLRLTHFIKFANAKESLMELRKINRLTPACVAASTRLRVKSILLCSNAKTGPAKSRQPAA